MRLCLKRSTQSSACMRSSQGKVYIVTGANTGIGYAAAKALASKNARVYMASRNRDKQQRSADQSSSQNATGMQLTMPVQCSVIRDMLLRQAHLLFNLLVPHTIPQNVTC